MFVKIYVANSIISSEISPSISTTREEHLSTNALVNSTVVTALSVVALSWIASVSFSSIDDEGCVSSGE
jgi:hypothetical protein